MSTIIPPATVPTNIPTGHRRPILVTGVTMPAPTTLPGVFRRAARILAANGLHQGDYCPDPFDRRMRSRHEDRPLSIVAALRCALARSPHVVRPLSDEAIRVLAGRLEVDGEPGPAEDELLLELHVDAWGDVEGRTTESAVAVLEAAADACEVAA
ncbi:DUF6197 family protein [Streptomyces lavendulocolor]|uniref:DUF6197 family protein n=1 Tax=Streptomyces lavendulocolor TaxID=67316 RepID=UPI003C2C61D4